MRRIQIKVLCGLLGVCLYAAPTAWAADVLLNPWTAESYASVGGFSDGIWTVSGDGKSVTQSINGQPTIFYSDFNAYNTEITGTIHVNTNNDNDYIGFVLGFQPSDSTNASADFLLIDWKQADQTYDFGQPNDGPSVLASEGLAVSRVTGVPTANELWGHYDFTDNPSGGVEELAQGSTLGSTGWETGTTYSFTFDFTPTQLIVSVDGIEQMTILGAFDNGRLGFYNFSQEDVTYAGFTQDPSPNAIPLPGAAAMGLVLLGVSAARRRRVA